MKKILFLSYDGMTDPLGQSQVIPYLEGLSKSGYGITILSFEKKERFKKMKIISGCFLINQEYNGSHFFFQYGHLCYQNYMMRGK